MSKMRMIAASAAISMAAAGMPAVAQTVQVYTNQALFDSQRPGIATNTFAFKNEADVTSYTQSGVTFTATVANDLTEFPAGATAISQSHLDAFGSPLSVTFAGPVLGLTFEAGDDAAETVSYIVNGVSGSFSLAANYQPFFIGFDTGSATKGITGTFTLNNGANLDIVSFQTAVPEAATWAMMMVGLGVVGGSLRRRQKVSTRVSFA